MLVLNAHTHADSVAYTHMSAIGILAELSDAIDCNYGTELATAEANAAKAGVLEEEAAAAAHLAGSRGAADGDSSIFGRVWVSDVLLLLSAIPVLVATRHYLVVAKVACSDFNDDQNSWCKETTKLRRECCAAALVSLAGYVLTAYYGASIEEQWQGGAALGLLVIGCVWGAKSALKLSRMGGLPDTGEEGGEEIAIAS